MGIQEQLTNLTKFGFDRAAYDASLDNINSLTYFINATYPDGRTVIYSLFYVTNNISLLQVCEHLILHSFFIISSSLPQIDDDPYIYTTETYRTQLNDSLNVYLALNESYYTTLDLTSGINSNVTKLIGLISPPSAPPLLSVLFPLLFLSFLMGRHIDTLDNEQTLFDALKVQVNATGDVIRGSLAAIDGAAYNLVSIIFPFHLAFTLSLYNSPNPLPLFPITPLLTSP